MQRFSFILLGTVWAIFGLLIIINPTFYHSSLGHNFNFSDVKWPFGGGLIAFGILCIWSSFRKKTIEAERKAEDDRIILMCPECIKPHFKGDCPTLKCPKCQAPLEELSGFYERNPELKDSKGAELGSD